MKLYYSPGACSLSPHIALHEAGLKFEHVLASTKTHQLADGTDYYTINPKGYVPLLEFEDGTRLTEGPAIVQWIADQVPEKKLAAGVAELHHRGNPHGGGRAVQPGHARGSEDHLPQQAW